MCAVILHRNNHLWLCQCRQHLIWWGQAFTTKADGFEFRITYSYKEWMFEEADAALLQVCGRVAGQVPAGRCASAPLLMLLHLRISDSLPVSL